MKIGIWNYYEELNYNNYLLLNKNAPIGDNLLVPFNKMYQNGLLLDIEFMTLDVVNSFDDIDAFIFFDFPKLHTNVVRKAFNAKKPMYLVIFESELIRPDNWNLDYHKIFQKIFTWNDEFVDNKKYFKMNFAQEILKFINKDLTKKEKLCTLIAGNKKVKHPFELYSKRVEAIRWFEKYHPEDFDLYGVGWDEHTHQNRYIRFLLKKLKLSKLFKSNFQSYKGKVESKKEVLEKYKFAICYENARDIPGYITEKIFDCFFAGCIPIYWGANNIKEYIPNECFVDKREFKSYEELYDFMHNMNDEQYMKYLDNIEIFLNSDAIYPFSSEYFAKTIIDNTNNKKVRL